jgi:RimJ/RimL family protein N-acetyltransferase
VGALPDVPVLAGALVRLEPLSRAHAEDLAEAAGAERDSREFTWIPHGIDEVREYIGVQLGRAESDELIPFAQIRLADARAVGTTTFFNLRSRPDESVPYAVEIGWTWLGPAARGTGINAEAKLLLLTYAFETWRVARVDLKTDARNERSRRAIGGLGAQFEGVLRSWSPSLAPGEESLMRDSALFSLLADEWPAAKAALRARLDHPGTEPRTTGR